MEILKIKILLYDEFISTPDIYIIDISSNIDFIIMGCDSIYYNLSVIVIIFERLKKYLAKEKKESKDEVLALNGDGKKK